MTLLERCHEIAHLALSLCGQRVQMIQEELSGTRGQRLAKPGGGQRDFALRMCPHLGIEIFAPDAENGPGRASIHALKDR
jgi:hypothetical protein